MTQVFENGTTSNEYSLGCQVCGRASKIGQWPDGWRTQLARDYVRLPGGERRAGLVCQDCYNGLQFFRHDPRILEAAVIYVEAWREWGE